MIRPPTYYMNDSQEMMILTYGLTKNKFYMCIRRVCLRRNIMLKNTTWKWKNKQFFFDFDSKTIVCHARSESRPKTYFFMLSFHVEIKIIIYGKSDVEDLSVDNVMCIELMFEKWSVNTVAATCRLTLEWRAFKF